MHFNRDVVTVLRMKSFALMSQLRTHSTHNATTQHGKDADTAAVREG